jgi:hypothetical protein
MNATSTIAGIGLPESALAREATEFVNTSPRRCCSTTHGECSFGPPCPRRRSSGRQARSRPSSIATAAHTSQTSDRSEPCRSLQTSLSELALAGRRGSASPLRVRNDQARQRSRPAMMASRASALMLPRQSQSRTLRHARRAPPRSPWTHIRRPMCCRPPNGASVSDRAPRQCPCASVCRPASHDWCLSRRRRHLATRLGNEAWPLRSSRDQAWAAGSLPRKHSAIVTARPASSGNPRRRPQFVQTQLRARLSVLWQQEHSHRSTVGVHASTTPRVVPPDIP